ncbi:hypothetical protein RR46_11252 [Papilio xuthus]|uniref:Uncharacterized protein n=1 Tax=Papilio xuthus TaxID=66420 RepID=A0A194PXR3_PAPXU|nr:hypothetical protein RR46_11252 [Papilio xuthus]
MKLWKSLKISIGSKTDPKVYSHELPQWGAQGYELDVFKSQTSLSTDSGLCTERGLRRTHIELLKPPGKRIGLKLADVFIKQRILTLRLQPAPSTELALVFFDAVIAH